jgi:hypothetical protein
MSKLFDSCPDRIAWTPARAKAFNLPGLDRHVHTQRVEGTFELPAWERDTVVASRSIEVDMLDVRAFLRSQAEKLVPPPLRRPTIQEFRFAIEDGNSRVPVQDAMISLSPIVRGGRPAQEMQLPDEVPEFAKQLRGFPCDVEGEFLKIAASTLEHREALSQPVEIPTVEPGEGPVSTTTGSDGGFSIRLYRNSDIRVQVRHKNYYFQEVCLFINHQHKASLWDCDRAVAIEGKNKFVEYPRDSGNYLILLQDIGTRIRQGD